MNEEVKEEEARDFAKRIGALFKLTSCVSNSNVTELFEELGGIYLGIYSIKKLNGEEDNATDEQIKEEALKKKEEIQKETGGIVITRYTKKEENKGCC